MFKKLWESKVTRFATVGVFNTLFDLSMLNFLAFVVHLPYLVANLISASISMTVSYFLNHHIVFRHKEEHSLKKFVYFFAITGTGILAIQSIVIYVVMQILTPHYNTVNQLIHDTHLEQFSVHAFDLNIAKIIAVLVTMTWNFLLYRFLVFKHSEEPADSLL